MKPIVSMRDLSWRLGVPRKRLIEIAAAPRRHYETWTKDRVFEVPDDELKDIQRKIKKNILDKLQLAEAAHGGVRGCSPTSNARQHLGQPCVVKVDVRKFFPNVQHRMIYQLFRHDLGFGRDIASLLTKLTTVKGHLPQGAPTSTALANLLLARPVDGPLSKQAMSRNIHYTRYVDDITLSGHDPKPLIGVAARLLSRKRLTIHRGKSEHSKLKILLCGSAQEVTGLIVNSKHGPSISKRRRARIRAAVFALSQLPEHELKRAVTSVRGRINHVRQFHSNYARRIEACIGTSLARRLSNL